MARSIGFAGLALIVCLGAIVVSGAAATGGKADEIVHLESAVYPPTPYAVGQALKTGDKPEPSPGVPLKGQLTKPDGEGPFPAVVLMHGCGGIWRWNEVWTARLIEWGYVVLDLDSFGPRGEGSICDRPTLISGETRALDAHGAKTFLAGTRFVDPARIAVFGMSHGGWATLNAVERATTSALALPPFRAAVALYPWCDEPTELDAPLLILIGERDDWCPAALCRRFAAGGRSPGEMVLHVYPGAHHVFDLAGIDMRIEGHVMRYDEQAAEDAARRVRAFLAKHL